MYVVSHAWLFIHLRDLRLNQHTCTVGEQLQSHLSGLNYSTPVNYSYRKICSNSTSIAWFAIQEESSPFCTGWGHTPASAGVMTLQHVSSSIPAPESAFPHIQDPFGSFYSVTPNNHAKRATVILAFTSCPSLLFSSFLCHYLEMWKSSQWVWIFTSST